MPACHFCTHPYCLPLPPAFAALPAAPFLPAACALFSHIYMLLGLRHGGVGGEYGGQMVCIAS